jgi:hypothetical protein
MKPSKSNPGNPKGLNGTEKLTEKMLHYCRCRASNLNMSDSYRESYGTSRMSKKTINEAASRLEATSKVQARVQQLMTQKDQALIRSEVGLRQKVLNKLELFMETATTQDTAKIRSAELLGKSIGLFKDVIEDSRNVSKSPEELTAILEDKLASLGEALH